MIFLKLFLQRKCLNYHKKSGLQLMDHLFLVDEMRCLVDEGHEGAEVVGPLVEDLVGILSGGELHDAVETIHFGENRLLTHQIRQKFFGFGLLQIQQLGHSGDNERGE